MLKYFKYILPVLFINLFSFDCFAQVEFQSTKDLTEKKIRGTGFLDYAPFGKTKGEGYYSYIDSIFKDFIKDNITEYNFVINDDANDDYGDLVSNVRRGKIDLLYGMYAQTQLYEGIDIVYPSLLSNPITVIMLPSRINEVKSVDDLKKLKGAISSREILSDYASREIKNFDVKQTDDSYKLFEMLFSGEVDYIFSSYYFGIAEAAKLGLRQKVSFSKQVIWNMPLFVGVSKDSKFRDTIIHLLEKASIEPDAKQKMEQRLKDAIYKIEQESYGVVPPAYSLKEPK